jgi:hypothetical protein
MRNVVLFLAIGIGAIIHFTGQLFPSLTGSSPGASACLHAPYVPESYLGQAKASPSLRSAVWIAYCSSESATPRSTNHEESETLWGAGTSSCQEIGSGTESIRYCRF